MGMDVVQLYDLLMATTSRPTMTTSTSNGLAATITTDDPEHLMLLEQTKQFLQVPVLLQDSDDSYVGAWPEQVPTLLQVHRGMQVVQEDQHNAKLVLQDLWELDQTSESSSTTIDSELVVATTAQVATSAKIA
jgi:hypothetical protein